MIKGLLVIIAVGGVAFNYTDVQSESFFRAGFLPFIVFLSIVSLALWLVMLFHSRGIKQTTNVGDPGGFGGSGDSGC